MPANVFRQGNGRVVSKFREQIGRERGITQMKHLKTLTRRPAEAADIPTLINFVALIQGLLTAILSFSQAKESAGS